MWIAKTHQLDGRTRKTTVQWEGKHLTAQKAYQLFSSSDSFRAAFIDSLSAEPFPAYFWETPPLTRAQIESPFEYVVTDAPTLVSVGPEVQAFEEHFGNDSVGNGVVVFENLSRDAMLVVPRPLAEHARYTHFAAFLRNAPRAQIHALLSTLGQSVLGRLGDRPLWVSTAGMGVYWLHVRLDSRPKYYRHLPYASL